MQQRLMKHHPVVTGLDLTQNHALDLAQGFLKARLLLRWDPLFRQGRFVQAETKELLRWWQQCQQHAAGQIQHTPSTNAIPRHRV